MIKDEWLDSFKTVFEKNQLNEENLRVITKILNLVFVKSFEMKYLDGSLFKKLICSEKVHKGSSLNQIFKLIKIIS